MEEMKNYIDIFLLLVIIVFLFFALKKILGKKVGYVRADGNNSGSKNSTPIVQEDESSKNRKDIKHSEESISTYPEGSLFYKLEIIKSHDKNFEYKKFIASSKLAFEMIVSSFSSGKMEDIKPFLTEDIFNLFKESVADRESKSLKLYVEIKNFLIADIYEVDVDDLENVSIIMKFKTQQIRNLVDVSEKNLNVSRGNIKEISEMWTFSKNIKENTSIWKLSDTKMN